MQGKGGGLSRRRQKGALRNERIETPDRSVERLRR
jgi:hypothetical protein